MPILWLDIRRFVAHFGRMDSVFDASHPAAQAVLRHGERAVPSLIRLVDIDKKLYTGSSVRAAALETLGQLRSEAAIETLAEALYTPEQSHAEAALRKFDHPTVEDRLQLFQERKDREIARMSFLVWGSGSGNFHSGTVETVHTCTFLGAAPYQYIGIHDLHFWVLGRESHPITLDFEKPTFFPSLYNEEGGRMYRFLQYTEEEAIRNNILGIQRFILRNLPENVRCPFLLGRAQQQVPCQYRVVVELTFETWDQSPEFEAYLLHLRPDYYMFRDYDRNMLFYQEYAPKFGPHPGDRLPVSVMRGGKEITGCLILGNCLSPRRYTADLILIDQVTPLKDGTPLVRNVAWQKRDAREMPPPIYRDVAHVIEASPVQGWPEW